jgi:hypothetical protein
VPGSMTSVVRVGFGKGRVVCRRSPKRAGREDFGGRGRRGRAKRCPVLATQGSVVYPEGEVVCIRGVARVVMCVVIVCERARRSKLRE